jgi:hypothetical protein
VVIFSPFPLLAIAIWGVLFQHAPSLAAPEYQPSSGSLTSAAQSGHGEADSDTSTSLEQNKIVDQSQNGNLA